MRSVYGLVCILSIWLNCCSVRCCPLPSSHNELASPGFGIAVKFCLHAVHHTNLGPLDYDWHGSRNSWESTVYRRRPCRTGTGGASITSVLCIMYPNSSHPHKCSCLRQSGFDIDKRRSYSGDGVKCSLRLLSGLQDCAWSGLHFADLYPRFPMALGTTAPTT